MMELPYSQENEKSVIYGMLADNGLIDRLTFLSVDDFYLYAHRLIVELIRTENSKGHVVDLVTIEEKVTDEMGGYAYIVDIWKTTATTKNVMAYAQIVLDMSIRRQSIMKYQEAIGGLVDCQNDSMKVISTTSNYVDEQVTRMSHDEVMTVDRLIELSTDEMERSNQNIQTGLSTGIPEIDERLGYNHLAYGEITFLGALSKNGKTLFANTIVARCDLKDDEVAHVFSVEMPATAMFNGIISAMSGVPSNFYCRQDYYHRAFSSRFDEWFGKWGQAAHHLNESGKITIDGKKSVDMTYICSEIRKQHALNKINGKKLKLVVIDHFHRLDFKTTGTMTYAMREALRVLKNTASDLNIAVLLLGQLNNSCEGKDPTSYHILDTSGARHEIQCFIGTRIFREEGKTYFGVYGDAHRYADHETQHHPAYMRLVAGVVKSLDESEQYWKPKTENEQ